MLPIIFILFACAWKASGWLTTHTERGYGGIFGRKYFLEEESDYEIFYVDEENISWKSEVLYDLSAFGSEINLKLQQNSHLIAPNFIAVVRDGNESILVNHTGSRRGGNVENCHYLHKDEKVAAAISLCQQNRMEGLLFLPDQTLEIYPLPHAFSTLAGLFPRERNGIPHIIRRANPISNPLFDDVINLSILNNVQREKRESSEKRMTVETALFLDEPGYKLFAPFFDYNDEKLRDMLLAYINGVQALYHHPSLGQSIDIVLIKMEIFKKQPQDLPHFEGERNDLLDSFCLYNEKHNPKDDSDPQHWDMGLYVSGLNFFTYENGKRSDVTMGLATVSGVCTEKYSCIIAEFGTTNIFGKPYPSAGFTSVYILAHEMGHNIGMHHDSLGNNCPKDGFIMSPSRGTNGETVWSSCSADVITSITSAKCLYDSPSRTGKNLDHSKFGNNPGQIWRAKQQCEILIRDHDAELYNPEKLQDICENLQCKTPHRSGFYFSGPALQGTDCGENKWCQGGKCVEKAVKPDKVVKGGWSDWIPTGKCESSCIKKSIGYQSRRRLCNQPKPINSDEGCEGPVYEVLLCKDDEICNKKKRKSIHDYATEKCREFSKILPDLDPSENGLQAAHESDRVWMACAIFCKRKDRKMYYTPRLELNDLGNDPYFPDGTWCHNDGIMNYYCVQHHCLPENFKYVKGSSQKEDMAFPQNAVPTLKTPSKEILEYLGLDLNGRPLLITLRPDETMPPSEEEWSDKDYIEIPLSIPEPEPLYY